MIGNQKDGLSSPKYDIGEGWAGTRLSKSGSNIEQLNSLNSYNNGPDGFGEINLMSANSSTVNFNGKNHNTKLFVNNNLIIDTNYAYYQVLHINYEIPSSTISSITDFKHEISDIGQGTDYQNIASINLCYPHNFDFSPYNKLHFGIPKIFNQKQHLSISNNINSSGNPILYVLDHVNKVIPFVFNNSWEAVIPASQSDSIICYLTTDSNINFINEIKAVNEDGYFNNFNSFQLDSAFIISYS